MTINDLELAVVLDQIQIFAQNLQPLNLTDVNNMAS